MTDPAAFSWAFLANDPAAAARVIEKLPTADAAVFLESCPPAIVAPVIVELDDSIGARLMAKLDLQVAHTVLQEMSANEVAFLLRHLDDNTRETILGALPKQLADRIRRHLAYPGDRVGSWTESNALTLEYGLSVAEALSRARESDVPPEDPIFLVGSGRSYRGAVPLGNLLTARASQRLGDLAVRDVPPLFDGAPVASVAELPIWAVYNRVAVVDRGNRFVGVLSEQAVRRALAQRDTAHAYGSLSDGEGLLRIGAGYVGALTGALTLLLARRD